MRTNQPLIAALALLALGGAAHGADATCPAPVKASIEKTFAKSKIGSCKAEHEDGRDQFEVKVTKADGTKAEVDVLPDGTIVQIEEKVDVVKLPVAVTKAFAAKYPKAKIDRGEKQTTAKGAVSYELAFRTDAGRKEATFTEDGKFVEEE